MKVAVIFGITGQDASYLSEFLLQRDYAVIGVHRRSSVDTTQRLTDARKYFDFKLVEGDVSDESSVNNIISTYTEADEIYNLAAQSHVHTSFAQPHLTWNVNAGGVLNILEAIRRWNPSAKFYQASTSEMFGKNYSSSYTNHGQRILYQDENTAFAPTSPYAIAKLAAHHLVKMYRDAYHIFACSGILFNHESERRGEEFVTRKISRYVGWFSNNMSMHLVNMPITQKLHLGNLNASRDWGHAMDYVHAMWLMLQQKDPDDYVVATGRTQSVSDFCEAAFSVIGVKNWRRFVHINEKYFRPSDVEYLCGDPSKARRELKWDVTFSFEELVRRMVKSDIEKMKGQPCPTLL